MAAFEHAVALGYRYVETDVHATADGFLVAFHDKTLDRLSDRTGEINKLTWADVKKARVNGEPIPLLEDVLGTWPDLRVNIDPKQGPAVRPLVDVIRRTAAHSRVCVAGFSDRRLARFRSSVDGSVCTALGPAQISRLRLSSLGIRSGAVAPDAGCVQVPTSYLGHSIVDQRFVDISHRHGLAVHIWTIDDATEMNRLLDLGVDGIMSDRPAVLKEVLQQRGSWA